MGAGTWRDAYGVPHVRADTALEVAREQGRATARDRSWQLEYQRRRATGTTAEVLGRPQLGWDTMVRRLAIADTAQRAYDALGEETRAFVAAYVEGVNAGLRADVAELTRLAIAPEPWQPWTPLAIFHAQHVVFSNLPATLWHHRARTVLGADERLLSRDPAYGAGSNAWAVGGDRTASGLPLIGGDPHRVIESPGVYMQVRLACDDPADPFDVVGFAFPGVPGVQHFAHTGEVAWAITNAVAVTQDVVSLPVGRLVADRVEEVAVRGAPSEPVAVQATDRGPVLQADPEDPGRVLVVLDPPTVLGELGFEALLPLLRARSVADVDRALDHWVEPVNNVVVADRTGRVRFRNAGRVPVRGRASRLGIVDGERPETQWSGWVDLPGYDVGSDGQVVTANEHRGPESDPIGVEFAPPDRAERIHDLLAGRGRLTPADFEAVHADVRVRAADAIRSYVAALEPGDGGRALRDAILSWDGEAAADSRGMAACSAWRSALTRRICAEPVFAPLADTATYGPVFAASLDVATHVGLALPRLLEHETPFGIDLRRLATLALADAADHPDTWGDTHVLETTHGFDLADDDLTAPGLPAAAVGGDADTVRCTGWLPGLTDACYRGSVARYVWDLADREAGGWAVVLGADGDPAGAHHHDQLDAWAAVRLVPIVTDWDRLTPETAP